MQGQEITQTLLPKTNLQIVWRGGNRTEDGGDMDRVCVEVASDDVIDRSRKPSHLRARFPERTDELNKIVTKAGPQISGN